MSIRYGSVCSGIEAATVAWRPLGWKAAWYSEIEKFPSAVLAHHYPDTPNLGDMMEIDASNPSVYDIDILVGGTPCQAFSVAGKRKSLDDERGNLTLGYIKLADSIDHFRRANGKGPLKYVVWENVPGVLNTKDNAFGCFLGGLCGHNAPIPNPVDTKGRRKKFPNAGVVSGPKRTVAWRTLDAQFFGLAQRRRRVFVIADSGDGSAPEILFEWEGVRRDTPPSREAGQEATPTVGTLSANGGGTSRPAGNANELDFCIPGPANCLSARSNASHRADSDNYVPAKAWPADIAPTLNSHFGQKQGLEDQHALGGAGLFVPADISPPLRTNHSNNSDPVAEAKMHVIQSNPVYGIDEETNAYPEMMGCLKAREKGGGFQGTVAFTQNQCGDVLTGDIAPSMGTNQNASGRNTPKVLQETVAFAQNVRGELRTADVMTALGCGGGKPGEGYPAILRDMAVRRLTPRECERLQGFPDHFTQVPYRNKPKEKCADGPRYKALGNSMAVPVMHWIGSRIEQHGEWD